MRYQVRGADGSTVEVEAVDWMMAMAHAIAELGIEVSGWACQTRPDGSVVVVDPMTGRYWEVEVAGPSTREDNPIIEGRTVAPSQATADDIVAESAEQARFAPDATPTPAPARPPRRPRAATVADFGDDDSLDFGEPIGGDGLGEGDSVLDTLDAPEPPPRPDTPPPRLDTPAPRPDTPAPRPAPSRTPERTLKMPEPSRPAPAPTMPPSIGTPTPSGPGSTPPPERPRPSRRPRRQIRAESEPRPERVTSRPRPAPPSEPPTPRLPAGGSDSQAPEDLAEQLFDLSAELSSATDAHDACRRALDLCLRLIPCEAGSVLRGGINDAALTFVAVAGPAADQLLNRQLPFGHGIVGASFDLGITIGVDDVGEDPRHASDFDQETGFRTRSVLCVPVQGREHYHGAIQLLNPISGRFVAWHRDAVEQLAASLASFLDG